MKPYMFITHNEGVDLNKVFGSSLIGYLKCSYQELIDSFGDPMKIDLSTSDGKTDVEWEIEFQDGTYLHIYNWKNGKNYLGEEGLEVEDMTEWNVGGHSKKDLDKLQMVFQVNKIKALVSH
tara:strand:+ start:3065 stop:3427 length:363 start_codon:yes stop_codon:yes gene_type:complete